MRTRKVILIGVILIAAAVGVLRFASLSKAAASHGAAAADDCPMFSCIFNDDGGDDD